MIFMGGGGGEGGNFQPALQCCQIYFYYDKGLPNIFFYSFFGSIYTLNKERMSNFSFMVYIQNVQSIVVHLLLRYA